MSSISYRHSIAIVCCALPFAATAQTTSSVQSLDNIVVTASRSPQLISETIGDVTVIGKKELERAGQNSVAEILAKQPGVQFTSTGGPQTLTSVFLRGTNPNQTLVLIDGLRVNGATSGGVNWNALDPSIIERIEILRGSASSLYGSSAIGGVINIITNKTGEDRPLAAWGNIGLGTDDTFKSSVGFSGARDGWDYALSSFMASSDGFNATRPESGQYTYNPDRDGYEQHGFSGTLGYQWQPGHHIGINLLNSYIDGQYDAGPNGDARTITRQQAYSVTSTNQITDTWESVLRFGLTKEFNEPLDPDYGRTGTLQRSWTWQNNFKINDNHSVSALLERLEERVDSTTSYDLDARNTNAVALIYRGNFFDALRTQASLRNDNISGYGNKQTGSLGADYDLTDHWSVGMGASTGFRAPTFNDLYWPADPVFGGGGNPDLKPEKSRNIEARLNYDNTNTQASITIYQNKIRDLIAYDTSVDRSENINKATIRGITLAGAHTLGNTTLSGNIDLMNPRDDTTRNTLMNRAKQVYNVAVNHRIDAWNLGAEYQFVGKRYGDVNNLREKQMGGYSLFNLTAAYDFTKNVGVQVRWNNIFDKDYTNIYGYNTPGSNVFVNLSFRM